MAQVLCSGDRVVGDKSVGVAGWWVGGLRGGDLCVCVRVFCMFRSV